MTNPQIPHSIKSGVPLSEYVAGLILDNGQVVYEILSKSNLHVVYRVKGSRGINCEYAFVNLQTQELISKVTALIHLSEERFHQTAVDDITKRVVPIFGLVFFENIETAQKHIRELERYIYRRPSVKRVIAETDSYSIWVDSKNMVNFSHFDHLDHLQLVLTNFTKLRAQGSSFIPQGSRFEFSEQLGAALAVAIETLEDDPDVFRDVENLLAKTIDSSLRTRFSMFSIGSASFLLFILFYFFNTPSNAAGIYIPAIAGGILGAFISVQSRVRTIKCDISDPAWTLKTQAFIRIVLGGIFGFIAFAMAKTGIVFSVFSSSDSAMILLGVISGFSERLIPELLQKIEKKQVAE